MSSLVRDLTVATIGLGIGSLVIARVANKAGYATGFCDGKVQGNLDGFELAVAMLEKDNRITHLRGQIIGLTRRIEPDSPLKIS
ncbi:hypothetical protein [Streptosporangium sp. NPDC051022]|uniref:hypothetical protein n=1 Tax=Streptosporangium sp. NPDC051022 TaxID=3155752 RepID=UPI0034287962